MNAKVIVALIVGVLVLCLCIGVCGFLFATQNVAGLASRFLPEGFANAQATLDAIAPTVSAVATVQIPSSGSKSTSSKAAEPTRPAASSAGSTGNIFADALNKANSATKFRIEFSWIFGGMESGKYKETPFIDLTGEMDNGKAHMTSKGGVLAMLAANATTPIEIIEADGNTYMRGVSMFGMGDPKVWYITDDSMTSTFSGFTQPDSFNDWTGGAKPSDFKKVRSENLDSKSCDVYLYDVKGLKDASFLGLLGASQSGDDFGVVDKGEMSFWLCNDGYVHKFLLDYQGHNTKDATQKAAMKMTWHAWDYGNAAIGVTAPKDAKKLPGQ